MHGAFSVRPACLHVQHTHLMACSSDPSTQAHCQATSAAARGPSASAYTSASARSSWGQNSRNASAAKFTLQYRIPVLSLLDSDSELYYGPWILGRPAWAAWQHQSPCTASEHHHTCTLSTSPHQLCLTQGPTEFPSPVAEIDQEHHPSLGDEGVGAPGQAGQGEQHKDHGQSPRSSAGHEKKAS